MVGWNSHVEFTSEFAFKTNHARFLDFLQLNLVLYMLSNLIISFIISNLFFIQNYSECGSYINLRRKNKYFPFMIFFNNSFNQSKS